MQKPPNPKFISIMESASLDEKKQMWSILSDDIAMCEARAQQSISEHHGAGSSQPKSNLSSPPKQHVAVLPSTSLQDSLDKVPDISNFVEHVSDLGINRALDQGVMAELSSLGLLNTTSKKVKSQWLSPTSDSYEYGAVCNKPKPIDEYPNICKLMGIVNAHPSTTGDSDGCFVTCYSSNTKSLKLHKDNEDLMCQSSSISSVSFGAPRKLEFVRDGKETTNGKRDLTADIELDASHLTMNVMKPGAQKIMKHRVPKGSSVSKGTNVRYSLSFRKIVSQSSVKSDHLNVAPTTTVPATTPSKVPSNDMSSIRKQLAVLIAGDSFTSRLDVERLGKGKKKVIKVAQGGLKICEVQDKIEKFVEGNTQYDVQKVILSIGTNDIRHCKNGVKHLKNTLCDFMKYLKSTFPTATIYFQSIIPLAHNNCRYVISNVLNMNNLIFTLCSRFHLYYLDVFGSFLNQWGYRNDRLFPEFDKVKQSYDIHPNDRGMGVLARNYIYLIHSRWFNPMGY